MNFLLRTRSRTIAVMIIATLTSISADYDVGKLDGEAELHKNVPSISDVVQSGKYALLKIAKLLAGLISVSILDIQRFKERYDALELI